MKKRIEKIALSILSAVIVFNSAFTFTSVGASDDIYAVLEESEGSDEILEELIEEDEGSTTIGNDETVSDEELLLEEENTPQEELLTESDEDPFDSEDVSENSAEPDEAAAEFAALTANSGKVGDNIDWKYDSSKKTLTLSGAGATYSYAFEDTKPFEGLNGQVDTIVVKSGITTLGAYVLAGIGRVSAVTLEDGLEVIEKGAFFNTGFRSISFPSSVKKINLGAIYYSGVSNIHFAGDAPEFEEIEFVHGYSGGWFDRRLYVYYPYQSSTWTEAVALELEEKFGEAKASNWNHLRYMRFIPEGKKVSNKCGDNITWTLTKTNGSYNGEPFYALKISGSGKMYDYSFFNCAPWFQKAKYITKVEISPNITHIGAFAFFAGTESAMGSLVLPASLKTVGDYAFFGCSFSSFKVNEKTKLKSIGERGLFCSINNGGEVVFPASAIKDIESIGDYALRAEFLVKFEELYINTPRIGEGTFLGAKSLSSIVLGPKVEAVGEKAFKSCGTLQKLDLGNVKTLEEDAFYGCEVEELTVPESFAITDKKTRYFLPKVSKKLYLCKNYTYFCGIEPIDDVYPEIHCSGDYLANVEHYNDHAITIYYPVGNATWLRKLDVINRGKMTFIPYGEENNSVFTVKFVTNCSQTIPDQQVPFGGRVVVPELTKKGEKFEGWFSDEQFKEKFYIGYRVGSDMTLYAKWGDGNWGDISERDRIEKGFKVPSDVKDEFWFAGANVNYRSYNGDTISFPNLHVYKYKTRLKAKKDYTVSYKADRKAGQFHVTIKLKGKYKGSLSFDITPYKLNLRIAAGYPKAVDGVTFKLKYDPNIYVAYKKGKNYKVKPSFTLMRNGKKMKLTENVDYKIEYGDTDFQTTGMKHKIVVSGTGFFEGKLYFNLEITDKKDIRKATVGKIANREATGRPIELDDVVVKYKGKRLIKGTDYKLSYSDNGYIGKATVYIEGIGKYGFAKKAHFNIVGRSIKKCQIKGFRSSVDHYIKGATQDISLVEPTDFLGEENAVLSKDYYTVSYENNKKPGTATMIIKGKKLYTGTIKKTYKITGYDMKKVTIKVTTAEYSGESLSGTLAFDPTPYYGGKVVYGASEITTWTLLDGEIKNAGTYRVKLMFHKKIYGTKELKLTVKPFEVNSDTCVVTDGKDPFNTRVLVQLDKSYPYAEGGVKPSPAIYFKTGKGRHVMLREGVDYTVSYKNNKKVGKATATITFKGNFSGSIQTNFNIVSP